MKIELHTGEEITSLLQRKNIGFPYLSIEEEDYNLLVFRDNHGQLFCKEEDVVFDPEQEKEMHSWFDAYDENPRTKPGLLYRRKPGSPLRVGLVSCSASKAPQALEARNFYLGDLFRKSKAWAEHHCDEWAVLSAKGGLVLPDQVVAPYDKTLKSMPRDERAGWAKLINSRVYMQWGEETSYVLLCGELYRLPFEEHNTRNLPFEVPMKGLGLGEQKSWLKRQLKSVG